LAKKITHLDSKGNAIMVDISSKKISARIAIAKGSISVNKEVIKSIKDNSIPKGDVLAAARIAGIMAAKRCSELIPLCHTLAFDECVIDFTLDDKENNIDTSCRVKLLGKTGAEMEALTAVSVALLTIYDMCKAIDKKMVIGNIFLLEKTGGKST